MTTGQQPFTFDESVMGVVADAGTIEVTREMIARYCEVLGETNPLWTDDTWAATGPYGGIVAPPGFVSVLPARSQLNPKVKFGNSTFLGGRRIEAHAPVRPGDLISVREQITDVYAKTGRTGTMVFAIRRMSYVNQNEVTVGVCDTSVLYRETQTVASAGSPEPAAPEPPRHRARDVEGQRYIEDVEPADEFEGVWDVTKEQVADYLVLTRPPTAPQGAMGNASYFLDDAAASKNGLTRPIAHGGLSTSICMRLVTDWIGAEGWLQSIDTSFRRPAMHGDHLRVLGLVTDVEGEIAKIDVYLENERGERPIQGVATVRLPHRP
ncbi:MAG: MaoC family dehydratase N-terminal domain-containing protein [Dehalococcoidia bacterium]